MKGGKALFEEHCSVCHALEGDGKNAAAPVLGGVIGRAAGTTSYPSSKALKGSGIIWSDKHIFMYLVNPGKYVPGNKMSFAGLSDPQDRANVIAYLNSV